jgi:hypothetical protein
MECANPLIAQKFELVVTLCIRIQPQKSVRHEVTQLIVFQKFLAHLPFFSKQRGMVMGLALAFLASSPSWR